jgi:hypothetical protein
MCVIWLQVTWSLSSEDMYKPDGFILYYRKMNSGKFGPVNLAASTTQYLLGNLGKTSIGFTNISLSVDETELHLYLIF